MLLSTEEFKNHEESEEEKEAAYQDKDNTAFGHSVGHYIIISLVQHSHISRASLRVSSFHIKYPRQLYCVATDFQEKRVLLSNSNSRSCMLPEKQIRKRKVSPIDSFLREALGIRSHRSIFLLATSKSEEETVKIYLVVI